MELDGRVAVVTGGANGIGRALCAAFAEEGAAGIVVADIDGEGAAEVVDSLGGAGCRAIAIQADVSKEADVSRVVAQAESAYGAVDLFCANAGIFVPGGIDVADAAWARAWAVNVQAHLYAARAVLPKMLARGEGYLLHTASAAGLLTQLNSAPYSVTKHAVVALAEWLAITYGDRGIRVSCLCPQAVATSLTATSRRSLAAAGVGPVGAADPSPGRRAASAAALDGVLTAEQVAAAVIEALAEERFLILPHPQVALYERRRAEDRDRWLTGMRRLQARAAAQG